MAERIAVNKVIGRDVNGDIYIARDFFDHGSGYRGVTGDVVRPVEMWEIDAACTYAEMAEYLRDVWAEHVRAGRTDGGLRDWINASVPLNEYIDMRFEPADVNVDALNALIGNIGDVVRYEFISCGRVFSRAIEWETVWDATTLDEILEWEG